MEANNGWPSLNGFSSMPYASGLLIWRGPQGLDMFDAWSHFMKGLMLGNWMGNEPMNSKGELWNNPAVDAVIFSITQPTDKDGKVRMMAIFSVVPVDTFRHVNNWP